MSRWKLFRYRLEEAGCRVLAALIPRLSRKACVRLANFLGGIAFSVDRRGRAVSLANLECVFGDRFTPEQRIRIGRASYQNFVRTMLDLFWSPRLNSENFHEWLRIENFDSEIERYGKDKSGPVLLCGHHGNWEWTNLAAGFSGFGQVSVAENFKNPRLTAIFNALREGSGATLIAQENSFVRMFKAVKRGRATALVLDLTLPPSQAATIIETFRGESGEGLKMCVPILHAVLAQRAGARLLLGVTEPRDDGGCRLTVLPEIAVHPDDSINAIAQKCWDCLEPAILARPEHYLWAYKHFRFRPRDAVRSYPAYSNESRKFEKLLREVRKDAAASAQGNSASSGVNQSKAPV